MKINKSLTSLAEEATAASKTAAAAAADLAQTSKEVFISQKEGLSVSFVILLYVISINFWLLTSFFQVYCHV